MWQSTVIAPAQEMSVTNSGSTGMDSPLSHNSLTMGQNEDVVEAVTSRWHGR
jgi:hypothetical protein